VKTKKKSILRKKTIEGERQSKVAKKERVRSTRYGEWKKQLLGVRRFQGRPLETNPRERNTEPKRSRERAREKNLSRGHFRGKEKFLGVRG